MGPRVYAAFGARGAASASEGPRTAATSERRADSAVEGPRLGTSGDRRAFRAAEGPCASASGERVVASGESSRAGGAKAVLGTAAAA